MQGRTIIYFYKTDYKEQTPVCSLVMFLSFKLDLTNSLHGLIGRKHSANPPFLSTITNTEFLQPEFSISSFHQLVLQTAYLFAVQLPSCAHVHFIVKVQLDFPNTCSLTVNDFARFLQSWQTHEFWTSKITRIIIVTIF